MSAGLIRCSTASRAPMPAPSSATRDELGFRTDMTYVLLSGETSGHWNWREGPR